MACRQEVRDNVKHVFEHLSGGKKVEFRVRVMMLWITLYANEKYDQYMRSSGYEVFSGVFESVTFDGEEIPNFSCD